VVADGAGLKAAGGADVLLFTGNSYAAAQDALGGLRPDARVILMGVAADELNIGLATTSPPFLFQRYQVIGSTHNGLNYLNEALEIVASGNVTPMIETFAPTEVGIAAQRVADGDVRFRAVIDWS
jgi:dehydrogenase